MGFQLLLTGTLVQNNLTEVRCTHLLEHFVSCIFSHSCAVGQGSQLVEADKVIFVDSDFNPQNDLQAAARAHRLGQTRCAMFSNKSVCLLPNTTV